MNQTPATPLAADLQPHLAAIAGLAAGVPDPQGVAGRRRLLQLGADYLARTNPAAAQLAAVFAEDVAIAGAKRTLRARRYRIAADAVPPAVLVYFHGGGWIAGDLDTHDGLMRRLALLGGFEVLAIDYRRPPEARYPAPLEDAVLAMHFAANEWSQAAPPRLFVGGDSAGGHLAAAIAGRLPQLVSGALLLYPVVRPDFTTRSYREQGIGLSLTPEAMRFYWSELLGRPIPGDRLETDDPGIDLLRQTWSSPPAPAVVVAAWHDPLFDEALQLADAWRAAGAPVELLRAMDMPHGFARLSDVSPSAMSHVRAAVQALLRLPS